MYKGTVQNVILVNSTIKGSDKVGDIVGYQTSTIMLPFAFDASVLNGTLHTIDRIYEQDDKWWVAEASTAVTTTDPDTPYLFKPTADIEGGITFTGVTLVRTVEKTTTIDSKWQFKGITATDRDEIHLPPRPGIVIVLINNKTYKLKY